MKKTLRKSLSILLAVLMIVASMPMAFATETKAAEYDGDPIVVVRGIDFAGLVNGDGSKAISIEPGKILNAIKEIGIGTVKGDDDAVINALVKFGLETLGGVACDKEGNPVKADVHIPKFLTSADKIDLSGDEWADTAVGLFRSAANKFGGKNVYLYTFDWRLSPSALADDLNSFLELVKTETGKNKLDIAACSMGGMITTAYIDKYGTDSLDSVVYLSTAHNGGHIVGSAFTGDLVIDSKALGDFLIEKTSNNFGLNLLIKILNAFGTLKIVVNYVNDLIANNKDKLYDELLRECFGSAFGLWALIPDEKFDQAVNFFYAGEESEYATALREIAKVKEFVFKTDSIMKKAYDNGVKVSFVSHYNSKQLPIYSGYKAHGDGVLESDRTSGYAKFAKYGETLTDAEIAGVAPEYISPDRVVNASTCLYKDTTWIVKNAKHVGCKDNSDHTEFAIWLLTSEVQPTVKTNPAYPRFMNVDSNENFIGF